MSRRGWAVALLGSVVLLLGLLVYVYRQLPYAVFQLLGPGDRWGADVVEMAPEFAASPPPAVAAYLAAPTPTATPAPVEALPAESRAGLTGTVFLYDVAPRCGVTVTQTFGGSHWRADQRLYVGQAGNAGWRELLLPPDFVVRDAIVVCPSGQPAVLFVRRNAWDLRSYARYLQSISDASLRSAYGVYRFDLAGSEPEFMFPGHTLLPSPDRRYVAYTTSENGSAGFHNILVYEVDEDRSTRVLSLSEVDPGSGISFSYHWSADAKALIIAGLTRGWTKRMHESTHFRLVFLPETRQLFDLGSE